MRYIARFALPLLAVLVLGTTAACGGTSDGAGDSADAPQPGGSTSAESPSATPSADLPTVEPPGSKPAVPPPPGQGEAPQTVRGVVAEGVEAGCLVLNTDSGPYVLIGGDRRLLQPGRTVEVVGVPDPSMVTTCQQGTPMKVTSVKAG